MTPSLECGDPAPDFMLPNREGKLAKFYDRFAGNAVVLCFCLSCSGKLAETELRAFAERRDRIDAVGGRVVVVTQDGYEANAAFALNKELDLDILSDPVGAITRSYGAEPAATGSAAAKEKPRDADGLSTFVINANQCVATTFHGGGGHAERALDCLRELQQRRSEPRVILQQAPVLLLPDVFDPALCQRLIADWERDHFEGVITRGTGLRDDADRLVVALSVKKRRDHRLSDDTNVRVSEVVGRRVTPMLHKTFQFSVGFMQHFRVGAYSAAPRTSSSPTGTTPRRQRKTGASLCP